MKKYYIDGKEATAIEKVKHKLKQLNEASELLEEISDRCAWADDFAHYQSGTHLILFIRQQSTLKTRLTK